MSSGSICTSPTDFVFWPALLVLCCAACLLLLRTQLWDLDSGRVIRDTWRHGAAVTGLEFNQVEFLMVSSGADRTVRVWDLELFEEMECMGPEATAVQGIAYAKDGSVLLSATADALKVWGLDPARHHDTVPIEWRNLADLHLYYKDNQPRALGCCRSGSTVGVFMVDLRKVAPFCRDPSQVVGIGAGGTQHASSSSSVRSTAGNAAQEYQGTRQLALPQQQPSLRSDLGSDSDKGSVPGYMSLLCEAAVASAAPEPIEAGPLTRQLPRTRTPPRAAAPAGITHSSSANSRQAGPPIVQPSQQPSPARRAAQAQPVPVQLSPRQDNARQQQHSHGRQQQQQDLSKGSNYFPEVEIRVPSGRTPPPAAVEQPMLSMQPPSRGQQRGHSAAGPGPAAANGRMQQELAPDSVTQLASGLAAASLLDPQRQQPQHEARSSSSTRPKEGSGAGGVLSATLAAWLDELPEASAPDHASSAAHSKASSRSSSMPASRVPSRHNMGGILQPQQQLVAAGGASAAAAPADPILAAMAGRVGLKVELARMVAALQVAKGFASRGNLEGAYKSVLHQGDPALACMVLEAVSQRADAFELNSLEPLIKLLELLLGSGHDQQVRTGLSALGLVLRGPGQTVHDVCSAPQPTGVDLSFEARHSKCMILKMALEGLGLKVGVLSRSQGATGTQAQMLAEELKRVVSVA